MTLTLFQGHIGVKLVGSESVKFKLCLATSCCAPEEIAHVGTLHSDQFWREITDQFPCLNNNLLTLAASFFLFLFPLPNCSAKSLKCFKMVTLFDPVATEHLLWRCPLQVSPRVPQGQKLCTWEREGAQGWRRWQQSWRHLEWASDGSNQWRERSVWEFYPFILVFLLWILYVTKRHWMLQQWTWGVTKEFCVCECVMLMIKVTVDEKVIFDWLGGGGGGDDFIWLSNCSIVAYK